MICQYILSFCSLFHLLGFLMCKILNFYKVRLRYFFLYAFDIIYKKPYWEDIHLCFLWRMLVLVLAVRSHSELIFVHSVREAFLDSQLYSREVYVYIYAISTLSSLFSICIIDFDINKLNLSFFFFRIVLATQCHLKSHMNFMISLSIFVKKRWGAGEILVGCF